MITNVNDLVLFYFSFEISNLLYLQMVENI